MSMMTLQLWGAGCFGALMGWYVYYINRYRKGDVQLADLVTVVGVLGGAGVLKLFPEQTALFGAYGIGLAVGFFGYLFVLIILVAKSPNFSSDWFLDGRRKKVADDMYIPEGVAPTVHAMSAGDTQQQVK